MDASARRGDLKRVQEVFQCLQDLFSRTGDPRFKPNDECQKAMIIALAKKGAAAEAEGLLDELVERTAVEQNPRLMPKRNYFVDILVAWSKDKNEKVASEQSQRVLMRILDLSKSGYPGLMPDSKCFERVMHALAKRRHQDSVRNIHSLLLCMEQVYNERGNESINLVLGL